MKILSKALKLFFLLFASISILKPVEPGDW